MAYQTASLRRPQTVDAGACARRQRPSSAKLSGVKFELYHPRLPTLRRMDMDTVCHKLSSEHSRTTTPCSRDDFVNSRSSVWTKKNSSKVHCKGILDRPTAVAMETYKPHGTGYTDNWNTILSTLNSKMTQQRNNKPAGSTVFHIDGLAVRRRHHSITSAWQHTRAASANGNQCRPVTPKPLPATMYSTADTEAQAHSLPTLGSEHFCSMLYSRCSM